MKKRPDEEGIETYYTGGPLCSKSEREWRRDLMKKGLKLVHTTILPGILRERMKKRPDEEGIETLQEELGDWTTKERMKKRPDEEGIETQ